MTTNNCMLISSNGNELCRVTCCKQWQPLLLIDLKGSHVDYNTITQLVQQSKRDIEQKNKYSTVHTHTCIVEKLSYFEIKSK